MRIRLTTPSNGADKDLMSAHALADAAATDEAAQTQFESRRQLDGLRLDIPRYVTNPEPTLSEDLMVRSAAAPQNTQHGSHYGQS